MAAMNDPSNEVVKAFFTALNTKTTLPVYSMVPSGVDDYIYIGDYVGVENSAKDRYITEASIQIEFVKRYRGQATKTAVNTDVDTVIGLVRTAFSSGLTLTGYTMAVTTIESVNDFVEEDDEYKIYRKFVRFRLIIQEN
jgi:hypothetical protein